MPYQIARLKHVFIACWQVPIGTDGPKLVADVKAAFQSAARQLVFVSFAPADSPPPPDELRKFMGEHVDEMLQYCSALYVVIGGSGFMQSAKRMAMASIVLVSGRRKQMHVHDSLESVRVSLPAFERDVFSEALRQAELDGVLPAPLTQRASTAG